MPGWWYTQVSKKTLPSTCSSRGGFPSAIARPRNRPQWYGTAPPPCGMIRRRVGKSREQVALYELHERCGVGVEVVRAGGVEGGVDAGADVDHRREVVLDQLLVERVPGTVGQRRRGPVPARRVGVEVDGDGAELLDAAGQFRDTGGRVDARRLRQHARRCEPLRVEPTDAEAEFVADRPPTGRRS